MTLVAGVDSSTQSCKVVIVDAATGAVVREGRASHPAGTEVHPDAWWEALRARTRQAAPTTTRARLVGQRGQWGAGPPQITPYAFSSDRMCQLAATRAAMPAAAKPTPIR